MIIIFGWEKVAEAIDVAFETYCFHCQKNTEWAHCLESEWVTFFDIRTIRFKKEDFLVCTGCDDDLTLDKRASKKLKELKQVSNLSDKEWLINGFSSLIEDYQLSTKTEYQKEFIRNARKYAAEHKQRQMTRD